MSKYKLHLIDKDPKNNITIECDNASEAVEYKYKARKQGYKVTIRRIK